MSETVLYGINSDGLKVLGEYRNSHLAGPCVWDQMARHIGLDMMPIGFGPDGKEQLEKFWVLWELPVVPTFEKIVLLSTYDRVWVSEKNLSRLVTAFKEFINAFPESNTHLAKYVRDIENFTSKDSDIKGICWHLSSMSEDTWSWFDDNDEEVEYNFETGTKHWELFDDVLDQFQFEGA